MTYYQEKDARKFRVCTHLITRGAKGSSSDKYMREWHNPNTIINAATYLSTDVVGISVNGRRRNRVSFDKELVLAAMSAGCRIIKDNPTHANRSFNIGEQELSIFLTTNGYHMVDTRPYASLWVPVIV